MKPRFALAAAAAVLMAASADAATTTVSVQGMAPIEEGSFQLRQTTVRYGDLNIASKDGASALLARIDQAAAATCKSERLPSATVKQLVKQCRTQAVDQAVANVHSPELTMVANAK